MAADVVRVWLVPVELPPLVVGRCREVLDDGERARAAAFLSERDRLSFEVAHGALRILAGWSLGVPPAALRWELGRYGKPSLAGPWAQMSTSLSHSGGMVAVALAGSRAVGVDIEQVASRLDAAAMAGRFYPAGEAAHVAAGRSAGARAERFTRLWCRKEAVVKAAGGRLWPNLSIAVLDRDVADCREPADAYRVADVPAPGGFAAAVALAGAAPFACQVLGWKGEEVAAASVAVAVAVAVAGGGGRGQGAGRAAGRPARRAPGDALIPGATGGVVSSLSVLTIMSATYQF